MGDPAAAIAEAAIGFTLLMVSLLVGRLLLGEKLTGSWNLVTAMADDAIDYVNRMHQIEPDEPLSASSMALSTR